MKTEDAIKQTIQIFVKQGLDFYQINSLICGLFYGSGPSWTLDEATDYTKDLLNDKALKQDEKRYDAWLDSLEAQEEGESSRKVAIERGDTF